MSQERFEKRLAVRKPNPWITALACLPLLGVLALFVGWAATDIPMVAIAPHLIGLSAVLNVLNRRRKPWERREQVIVRASATELRVGGREFPRDRITRALYLPAVANAPPTVRVEPKRRSPLELVVENEHEGRQLLRALGMDASQSVASFRALSRVMSKPRLVFLAFLAMAPVILGMAMLFPHLALFFPVFVVAASLLTSLPSRVEVGADGVLIKWLWQRRFIRTSEIVGVWRHEQSFGRSRHVGAKVTLRTGEEVNIPLGNRWSDDLANGLVERIREAVEVYKRGDVESAALLLERRDRTTIAEWIASLRGVGAGATTLRTAAVDTERLWHLLENVGAPPKQRAAAAIALSASDEQDAKTRIRVAANAVAEPKLRVVLEAASETDEAAIERAMQELAEDDAAQHKA